MQYTLHMTSLKSHVLNYSGDFYSLDNMYHNAIYILWIGDMLPLFNMKDIFISRDKPVGIIQ